MPQFGLRHIYAAKYVNNAGTVTYTDKQHVGDAMVANIELRFAEGRLYAEDALAEYMRKAVGGTISLGVKYIKSAAQPLLFGTRTKQRTITYQTGTTTATASVDSIVLGGQDEGNYVGVAFYAPDLVDGVKKYTCVLIKKALFGPPSMSLQTAGESIQFNTPTTSGEFLADDSATEDLYEIASVDSIAAAEAWVAAVLS
ncbi:MAG: hypothetical protein J6S60_06175 [Oscillospiraceae bacterium]|nr:hypothetical protein [Oscillospiraceae bacterium]